MPTLAQRACARLDFPDSDANIALRVIFCGQARLLAERLERGYGIDLRSLGNLFRVAARLVVMDGWR